MLSVPRDLTVRGKRKHKRKMVKKNTRYPEAMGLEYDHIWNSNWALIGVGKQRGRGAEGGIPG